MKFTLKQFLTNPTGDTGNYTGSNQLIKQTLNTNYINLIQKAGKFEVNISKIKNSYFYHVKVPSDTYLKELYYDVVIKFSPNDEKSIDFSNISNYNITFFSNSPSFMYMYTYLYNKNNLLIPELNTKYSKIALTQKPNIKNPKTTLGYEKSIYYALLFIKDMGIFNKSQIDSNLTNKFKISEIKTQEQKDLEYKRMKSLKSALKKKTNNKTTIKKKGKVTVNNKSKKKKVSNSKIIKPKKSIK